VERLKENHPLAQHLRTHFHSHTQTDLSETIDAGNEHPTNSPEFKECLTKVLNQLIECPSLYLESVFEEVKLSEETSKYVGEHLSGKQLIRLNRRLLEEAYPRQFRPQQQTSRTYTLSQLKKAVARDLENMLNTKRELDCMEIMLEREGKPVSSTFKELPTSLIYYGIPDFTSKTFQSLPDRRLIQRMVQQTILHFEPRLTSVHVTVDQSAESKQSMHFSIQAILNVDPVTEPVTFDAFLQINTSEYAVTER
jgi:type VI secretion system protein ImpF